MRILRTPDVNTDAASSTASEEDVNQTVDNSSESTNTEETGTEGSLADLVQKTLDKSSNVDSTDEEDEQGSRVPKENQTEEESEESGEEEESDESGEESEAKPGEEQSKKEVPDDQLPFGKHPRFQQLIKEKNELTTKVQVFEEKAKHFDTIDSYCTQHGITGEQYTTALKIAAALNNDPVEAYKMLKPVVDQLAQYDDSRLPDDLQQAVDDATITEEYAKEIAQLRAKTKVGQVKSQLSAEQQQRQAKVAVAREISAWESNIRKDDPDYRPKASPTDPDGKYEFVQDKIRSAFVTQPPNSLQEAMKLVQDSYAAVDKAFSQLRPKPPVRKALRSSTPSAKSFKAKPKSELDVVNQALASSRSRYEDER